MSSSPPHKTTKRRQLQKINFRGNKTKKGPSVSVEMPRMKNMSVFEWIVLLQCFIIILDSGFFGNSSLQTSAKLVNSRRADLSNDNVRLLSYLDSENQISLENLEHISPAKLIGYNDSSVKDQNNENTLDDISRILQMDSPVTDLDKKTT